MAVSKDVPVGFTAIRVRFDIESSASPEQLDRMVELTERYCVVYQTLLSTPPVGFTLSVAPGPGD
jgi:uncharacterized OsmC-like protein